jgi:hypothetical protein
VNISGVILEIVVRVVREKGKIKMIIKIKKVLILVVVVAISLGVFIACDHQPSTINHQPSTINHQSPVNLAPNPSFEEGKVFNSGLYEEGKSVLGKPTGWSTYNQLLNDSTGWATDEAHTGKRSLKIVNISETDAYWQGEPIIFKKPVNAFEASIWTKTKDVNDKIEKGKFQLVFEVWLENGIKKNVIFDFVRNNHNWIKTEGKALFAENITKVVPYLYFSGATGTAWYDDVSLNPMNINLTNAKTLFDSNTDKFNGKYKKVSDEKSGKEFEIIGNGEVKSRSIKVNTNKMYKLSGKFKTLSTKGNRFFFGITPHAASGKHILGHHVNFYKNTETELVKSCKPIDTIIYVKNAINWQKSKNACVAFNVDKSGKFKDLPNYNTTTLGIDKIEKKHNFWKIYLSKPCGKEYPIGIKVREHLNSSSNLYVPCNYVELSMEWQAFAGLFTALSGFDNDTIERLPPGTKYVNITIIANYTKDKNPITNFSDIKLEEVKL